MVKLIGLALIVSSVLSLLMGSIINYYGSGIQLTGNVVSNIVEQPKVEIGFFDYLEAITLSYSIISLIMGVVFLVRV